MIEAQFKYKCRRCGKMNYNPCCAVDLARYILVEIVLHGVGGSSQKGGRVYMHTTHCCKDGGYGIADLQGFRVVDTSKAIKKKVRKKK